MEEGGRTSENARRDIPATRELNDIYHLALAVMVQYATRLPPCSPDTIIRVEAKTVRSAVRGGTNGEDATAGERQS